MRPYAILQPTLGDAGNPIKAQAPKKPPFRKRGVGRINPYTYTYTYAYAYTPPGTAANLLLW